MFGHKLNLPLGLFVCFFFWPHFPAVLLLFSLSPFLAFFFGGLALGVLLVFLLLLPAFSISAGGSVVAQPTGE